MNFVILTCSVRMLVVVVDGGPFFQITTIIDLGLGLDQEKMNRLLSLLALARPWIVVFAVVASSTFSPDQVGPEAL